MNVTHTWRPKNVAHARDFLKDLHLGDRQIGEIGVKDDDGKSRTIVFADCSDADALLAVELIMELMERADGKG